MRRIGWAILGLILLDGTARAAIGDFPLRLDAANRLDLSALLSKDPINEFKLRLIAEHATSYDDFVSDLKNSAPEVFDRAVFLHHSGSLQRATFESPRVLLFGRGAVLAFSEASGES